MGTDVKVLPSDVLSSLERSGGVASVSTEPGELDRTVIGRVLAVRESSALSEGSCNSPWSSWDS
jgi:hypothetical protein